MFAGVLMVGGATVLSATLFGLAVVFYRDGALYALLASNFLIGSDMRKLLGTFYTAGLLVPELGLLLVVAARIIQPTLPEWDCLVAAGGCAIGVNLIEIFLLARMQPEGLTFLRQAAPLFWVTIPFGLTAILGGTLTARFHSEWPDLFGGFGIAALQTRAPDLVGRIAKLDVRPGPWAHGHAIAIASHHPRLLVLVTPAWRRATAESKAASRCE